MPWSHNFEFLLVDEKEIGDEGETVILNHFRVVISNRRTEKIVENVFREVRGEA
jgi:hypothetical protein